MRKRGDCSGPVLLLRRIRHAYISLHQGTEAAPTAFSASTDPNGLILFRSSSYPLCTLTSHHSDSTDASPHLIQGETQPLPAVIAVANISIIPKANSVHAAAQTEETIITRSPTDLAITRSDSTSRTQPFPSASPTTEHTEPVQIPSQFTSLARPSVLTQDLNPPTVTTSTVLSAVVSGLADVSNAFQGTTSAANLSRPQEDNKEHVSTATLERDEEATEVPPVVVSHSQLPPMPIPAPPSNVIPEEVSSWMESPLTKSDSTSHVLGFPSSSAIARSQIALQVTSILDAHVTGSIRAVNEHNDAHGMDTPIPMEDLPHPNQSTSPAPGLDPVAIPEDGKKGRD